MAPRRQSAELTIADIIDQNQEHIWRAFRRLHWLRKLCRIGILISATDVSRKAELGPRKNAGRLGRISWRRLRLNSVDRGKCDP